MVKRLNVTYFCKTLLTQISGDFPYAHNIASFCAKNFSYALV